MYRDELLKTEERNRFQAFKELSSEIMLLLTIQYNLKNISRTKPEVMVETSISFLVIWFYKPALKKSEVNFVFQIEKEVAVSCATILSSV